MENQMLIGIQTNQNLGAQESSTIFLSIQIVNKEIRLVIVEWHNTKGQYKYTTRQYKPTKKDLTKQ